MAQKPKNCQLSPTRSPKKGSWQTQVPDYRTATPNSEFYAHFCEDEILEIIHSLEHQREIPLKFAYKGQGAQIWDNFYQKYIVPTWYRPSNVEIQLLRDNFDYLNGNFQNSEKINIIDVGVGNSYPIKAYVRKLSQLNRIDQYIGLDISADLLKISQRNFQKWFPKIKYSAHTLDIENTNIPGNIINSAPGSANIFLHLGVTIGNHQNRSQVLQNFRASMNKNDLLVLTNEIGSSAAWDGRIQGGCDYHAGNIYQLMTKGLGLSANECELIRKYDTVSDSVVANLKILQNYNFNFQYQQINQNIFIDAGEEITIWRHRKFTFEQLLTELPEYGLKAVHCSTNKYASHGMVICQREESGE